MSIMECGEHCSTRNTGGPCSDPRESYAGAVLAVFEVNGYDDSDFCAAVWTGERVISDCYASTRSWTYHNGAQVDATPAVLAAALAWYRARLGDRLVATARADVLRPAVGKRVRSLATRGKHVGVVGKVRWMGVDSYHRGPGPKPYRVGIKVEGVDTLHFLGADRVEAIDPEPIDEARIRARAAASTDPDWRTATTWRD